jgi:hypothetical protein
MQYSRIMRRLSPAETERALSWIRPAGVMNTTGLDVSGWDDSIWILHAMYENAALPSNMTYEQLDTARREAGELEPVFVGDVNLSSIGINPGTNLGFTDHPGDGWRRLTWADHFGRVGENAGENKTAPPSSHWFPPGSWPLSIRSPGEGSIDGESLRTLISILSTRETTERCYFHPSALTTGNYDENVAYEGQLSEVFELISDGQGFSPSNFWPADRAWFVYTDYDLWATRVSGSRELIAELESGAEVESLRWNQPER